LQIYKKIIIIHKFLSHIKQSLIYFKNNLYEWLSREVCYLELTGFFNFFEFVLFNFYSTHKIKIIISSGECYNIPNRKNYLWSKTTSEFYVLLGHSIMCSFLRQQLYQIVDLISVYINPSLTQFWAKLDLECYSTHPTIYLNIKTKE
jgi:hypothetical protein